jgi:uncharacterized protein YecE (DUF72 family)
MSRKRRCAQHSKARSVLDLAGRIMHDLRIGTSGWSYKHWRNTFYEGVPVSRWLECYAEVFDCVELNASFYRLPKRSTFVDWADRTPGQFKFAVKGSRFITHLKRLTDPHEHVERFFEAATGLGEKLGPVLWQLPPSFSRNDVVLEQFLGVLPGSVQHTIEFRHSTWLVERVFDLLRQHNVALCIPDHPRMPKSLSLTTSWTYARFHYGPTSDGNYPDDALRDWADWIRDRLAADQTVWAFFNNDWNTFAPANALTLRNELSVAAVR